MSVEAQRIDGPIFEIYEPPPGDFIFQGRDGVEMLRITQDEFYVRGVKVADGREVYAAFKEWLERAR